MERTDPPFGDAIMAFPRRIWVELAIHVDSPPGNGLSEGRQGFRSLKTVRSLKLSVTPLARDTQNIPASMEPSLRLWELLGLGEVLQGVWICDSSIVGTRDAASPVGGRCATNTVSALFLQ